MEGETEYRKSRPKELQTEATMVFAVGIAAIGAMMMTLTSSPTAKGASFLWLPAALQLVAGIWLGPVRGLIAGGLGAYAAGILAYGGFGLVDIIMNPIAGGFANSMLPAFLFTALRIDPTFGVDSEKAAADILRASGRIIALLGLVIIAAFAMKYLTTEPWAYIVPAVVLFIAYPLMMRGINVKKRDFVYAFVVCVFISAVSAAIGVAGQMVGGQTFSGAILGTGIGWFLGDTVSAILGLYILASFTARARELGVAS